LAGVEGIRLHTPTGDCLAVDFSTLERLINKHEEVFADQLQPLKPIRWGDNYEPRPKNPRKRKNKLPKAEKEYFNDKRMAMNPKT